jgi:hypothetical protein
MISCLEDDEIERQLKCKICDVGLCIFGCFNEYHTNARFSYMNIKQITTKKLCTLNFTLCKIKYLGLCVRFY